MRRETCPRCGHGVDLTDSGGGSGCDERTDPWVFIEHNFTDVRGGERMLRRCGASGKNRWTAEHSY